MQWAVARTFALPGQSCFTLRDEFLHSTQWIARLLRQGRRGDACRTCFLSL